MKVGTQVSMYFHMVSGGRIGPGVHDVFHTTRLREVVVLLLEVIIGNGLWIAG